MRGRECRNHAKGGRGVEVGARALTTLPPPVAVSPRQRKQRFSKCARALAARLTRRRAAHESSGISDLGSGEEKNLAGSGDVAVAGISFSESRKSTVYDSKSVEPPAPCIRFLPGTPAVFEASRERADLARRGRHTSPRDTRANAAKVPRTRDVARSRAACASRPARAWRRAQTPSRLAAGRVPTPYTIRFEGFANAHGAARSSSAALRRAARGFPYPPRSRGCRLPGASARPRGAARRTRPPPASPRETRRSPLRSRWRMAISRATKPRRHRARRTPLKPPTRSRTRLGVSRRPVREPCSARWRSSPGARWARGF